MSSNDNLIALDGKEGRLGFIIPYDIDSMIHHIDNFKFLVALILGEDSTARVQVEATASILSLGWLQLQMIMQLVSKLPAKILYSIYSKFQAFLQSCMEATIYKDIKFQYLLWDEDLINLIQRHG